jgi:hypothetical protein
MDDTRRTTMKTSGDFLNTPYPLAVRAVMKARAHGVWVAANEGSVRLKKTREIDDDKYSEVREAIVENKNDVLAILNDMDTYRRTLAQMRGQLVEFHMQIDSLLQDLDEGVTVYDFLFPEDGCFTGEQGGCNDPYIHARCITCEKEKLDENKKDKAV